MTKTHRPFTALLLLLFIAGSQAGPAEIHALEDHLATLDTQIAETEELMKQALSEYRPDAGTYGGELRKLKRERVLVDQELKGAVAEQNRREIRTGNAPLIQADPGALDRLGRKK